MPSDYKGPMRNGLWWTTPDAWQMRYERHLARRDMLARKCHAADMAVQQAYRLWREYPTGGRRGKYLERQHLKLKAMLNWCVALLHEEETEIKKIEDGHHEP